MHLLKKKIRGSSLVEVLVATVIYFIIMGICFTGITLFFKSWYPNQKLQAQSILNEQVQKATTNLSVRNTTYSIENIEIEETITGYNLERGLYKITLKAFRKADHRLLTEKTVVIHEEVQVQ